ncbi:hypothetical protein WJT74_05180 [Sphingomicrobium sp. XHP0239]|uniref:hypothetical protein n=1 Tax=Sphingomicrobium maritimum TaxID=3133972 RepID=UPI0031CCCB31
MARFNAATKTREGLKPFADYVRKKLRSPAEMAAMLKSMGAGSDMVVRRVELKGK